MWECKYGKEPLDLRLCALRLFRKCWLLVAMVLLGAFLFGGVYFLTHVVYAPAREYKAESEYYIEYKDVITEEQQYTFYNKETWEDLIHTDLFLETIMEELNGKVEESFLRGAMFATLLTDVRIVHVTVTTNSEELSLEISRALEKAFIKFGEMQQEVEQIRIILSPKEATFLPVDNRTVRAAVLGGVIFLCVTLFIMYLYAVVDTSILLPIEFERRFFIKMEVSEDKEILSSQSVWMEESDGEGILYVKSKDHNRQLAEAIVRDYLLEGKKIKKAVLVQADIKLIHAYMGAGSIIGNIKKAIRGKSGKNNTFND